MSMSASPAGGKRGRKRPMADINMTPMVDVMLVLLVIFMITAPAMKEGIDVDLPKASGGPSNNRSIAPLSVVVDQTGKVYFNGKTLEASEVETELPKLLKGHEKETLTLKAYRLLPTEAFVKVMSVARRAGITGFSIAVNTGK